VRLRDRVPYGEAVPEPVSLVGAGLDPFSAGFSGGSDDAESFPAGCGGSVILGRTVETGSFVADTGDCRLEEAIPGASLAADGVDVPELSPEPPDTFWEFGDMMLQP